MLVLICKFTPFITRETCQATDEVVGSYLGRVLQCVHSRVAGVLPTGGLGCLHEVPQGTGHVLHGVDQHHLGLLVLRAQAGRSVLHHVRQGDDGRDGVLGGDSQLFLGGGSASHQSLGVLHQGLGGLQDVLPVI